MQYLVKGEFIEAGVLLSPQQAPDLLERAIVPSLEALAKLVKEKKVLAGGIPVASRTGVMIMEAASHEELAKTLHGLPFWFLLRWDVTPLESFESRAALDREKAKAMRAQAR